MKNKKATFKSVIQFIASVFLLVALSYAKAVGEPMEPTPSKDAVNKLIIQINNTKQDENLVNNLLTIARYYFYMENKACKKYIDRALSISEKLAYDDGLIKSMCLRAAFLKNLVNDTASANNIIKNAISLSRKKKLPDLEAYAYYTKANWLDWVGFNGSAATEAYCIKSRNLYKQTGNKINEAYMLKCLADYHFGQNKFGQALRELLEALKIYKDAGYRNLHYTYDLLGTAYRSTANFEEALKYGLLAIKSAEQTKDTTDVCLFYLRVGEIFMTLKQPADALPYYSFVLNKTIKSPDAIYYQRAAASSIANVLFILRKPGSLEIYKKAITENPAKRGTREYNMDLYYLGNIYFELKQYDKAEQLFLRMLDTKEVGDLGSISNLMVYHRLGSFYISQHKYEKARTYINKSFADKSHQSPLTISVLNGQQFKVDSASGNYLSAIRHYQIYKAINDSIFNDKKSKQIASLNIQYETEKKEQKIGTLTAENSAQKVLVERRFFERNVFTAGAIMLLLLLLLSINRYRIKQRANKQLQEQQEIINNKNDILNCVVREKNSLIGEKDELLYEKEGLLMSKDKLIAEKEWLIKEVHHRVKNNLQMIATLLYSQASYLKDNAAIAAINESQQRIHAISLIHQKLYQSDDLQLVNMKSYVHELVDYLTESFDTAQEIEFNLEVDSFEMGLIKAIPLGLILNEAITNSLKYAFSQDNKKTISIQLQRREDCKIILLIKDNGKGMPIDFDPYQSDSLGISLMHGLSNQINADFSIKNENGTVISLEFEEYGESLPEQVNY